MAQEGPRQRRNAKKKETKKATKKEAEKKTATKKEDVHANSSFSTEQQEETLWQTFTNHPLVIVAPFVLLPYLMYTCIYYIRLQNPELLSTLTFGLLSLRPAVGLYDTRQVLILGTMGAGTQQVAQALHKVLNLEISHEASNTEDFFARDGTVSNWMAIRYASKKVGEARTGFLSDLCLNRTDKGSANVFYPKYYQPTQCSRFAAWSACHTKECLELVNAEWGCGLISPEDGCRSQFVRVLHQVQHPVTTIRELMAKVCPGDAKSVHPAFKQLASAFYDDNHKQSSCLQVVSSYVVDYNQALLMARKQGFVHAMFHYEQVSACDVASLAGFMSPELAMYQPNTEKIAQKCDKSDDDANKRIVTLKSVGVEESAPSVRKFTWDDFREAGGSKLVDALRKLCKDLGYDPDNTDSQGGAGSSADEEFV